MYIYREREKERDTVVSPAFQKFVLVSVFANLKIPEEDFCLCEKRQKAKTAFSSVLQ